MRHLNADFKTEVKATDNMSCILLIQKLMCDNLAVLNNGRQNRVGTRHGDTDGVTDLTVNAA